MNGRFVAKPDDVEDRVWKRLADDPDRGVSTDIRVEVHLSSPWIGGFSRDRRLIILYRLGQVALTHALLPYHLAANRGHGLGAAGDAVSFRRRSALLLGHCVVLDYFVLELENAVVERLR